MACQTLQHWPTFEFRPTTSRQARRGMRTFAKRIKIHIFFQSFTKWDFKTIFKLFLISPRWFYASDPDPQLPEKIGFPEIFWIPEKIGILLFAWFLIFQFSKSPCSGIKKGRTERGGGRRPPPRSVLGGRRAHNPFFNGRARIFWKLKNQKSGKKQNPDVFGNPENLGKPNLMGSWGSG